MHFHIAGDLCVSATENRKMISTDIKLIAAFLDLKLFMTEIGRYTCTCMFYRRSHFQSDLKCKRNFSIVRVGFLLNFLAKCCWNSEEISVWVMIIFTCID